MKTTAKYILQRILGFNRYLFVFSVFKVYTLKWDKNENHFLHFINMLSPKGVFIDIGANIGIMTSIAARKHKGITIHAIEPMSQNVSALKKIISFFGLKNIFVHQVALGNQNGKIKMVMPIRNKVRFQGLSHVLHESIHENNDGEITEVDIFKIDDFEPLKNSPKRIEGIKMDVENFEQFVVKGGINTIKQHKPVLYIELWDNENRTSCFNDLQAIGYKAYTLVDNQLTLYSPDKHHHHNFFFVCD